MERTTDQLTNIIVGQAERIVELEVGMKTELGMKNYWYKEYIRIYDEYKDYIERNEPKEKEIREVTE